MSESEAGNRVLGLMLLLALHLVTAPLAVDRDTAAPPPAVANPDGGRKKRDGRDDEDVR